jgi:hypothetical protein
LRADCLTDQSSSPESLRRFLQDSLLVVECRIDPAREPLDGTEYAPRRPQVSQMKKIRPSRSPVLRTALPHLVQLPRSRSSSTKPFCCSVNHWSIARIWRPQIARCDARSGAVFSMCTIPRQRPSPRAYRSSIESWERRPRSNKKSYDARSRSRESDQNRRGLALEAHTVEHGC